MGLKWSQIRNGFICLTRTKTSEPRQIPINDSHEELFEQMRKQNGFNSKHVFLYDGQIVEMKTGKVRKPKKAEAKPVTEIKSSFNSALKRANIADFRFHDLRHTFTSQVLMKGGTLKDVQELSGHETMTMTLRYAHLTPEHKRKAVNLLNGVTASKKPDGHKMVTNPFQEKCASL